MVWEGEVGDGEEVGEVDITATSGFFGRMSGLLPATSGFELTSGFFTVTSGFEVTSGLLPATSGFELTSGFFTVTSGFEVTSGFFTVTSGFEITSGFLNFGAVVSDPFDNGLEGACAVGVAFSR